ncbi:Anti-sigma regulatory factor (Ser/Thr protein kinase) [Micromonospora pattaloongensis]|uniref:Anti-sigma regulatory factor (Ser/Thr protein kinase) n=1 Tax=Micromonospora pattaloongensis TaxID=405436 RepID=A0A1H3FJC5_9ACTN|nr:sensor histidine kinase [Micromonospora pattaloongensis]SDX91030.1 Anti-sigma regulatory factor (Ser/Thr protein kinase) [Micromonospora pattaloongensis]
MTPRTTETFVHEGLLYRGCADYLAGTVPFVRDGLDAGEPVLVAVPQPHVELISDELGGDAGQVRFLDMAKAGRNPNRIIPWVLRGFVDEFRGRPVRIIGEPIWPGRAPEEIPLCVQHEALINVALADAPAAVLCPYDANALDAGVLLYTGRTHPVLVEDGERRRHPGYADPYALVALLNLPLPEPTAPAAELTFDRLGLAGVRDLVGDRARRAGLAPRRVVDLQLAVNEIATNAVTHADGFGAVRVWQEGLRVLCEVRGPGELTDWMAGRLLPPPDSARGRGLLLANRLCDLVQTYVQPDAITTRLHMLI